MPEKKVYAVTFRGTAEMTVLVEAESPAEARRLADDGEYEVAGDVAFVWGRPYTMKVRVSNQESKP